MSPKEHKDLAVRLRTFSSISLRANETKCSQEKLNASRKTPKLVLVSLRGIVMKMKSRKFTAFEWFVLLIIVVLVVGVPLLAIIPQ